MRSKDAERFRFHRHRYRIQIISKSFMQAGPCLTDKISRTESGFAMSGWAAILFYHGNLFECTKKNEKAQLI